MPARAEVSIPAALATATIVYAIHSRGLPPSVDMRAAGQPGDEMLETVRKRNAWMAAAAVAGISLVAKDPVIFIVGGVMVIALDWMNRVDIWASPATNKVESGMAVPRDAPTGMPAEAGEMSYGGLTAIP